MQPGRLLLAAISHSLFSFNQTDVLLLRATVIGGQWSLRNEDCWRTVAVGRRNFRWALLCWGALAYLYFCASIIFLNDSYQTIKSF